MKMFSLQTKLKSVLLAALFILCITGCGDVAPDAATAPDTGKQPEESDQVYEPQITSNISVKMNVTTNYGGYGVDGQNLGSGSFIEFFDIKAGDVFYEDYDGHWHQNENPDNMMEIASVLELSDNKITLKLGDGIFEIT